jgi:hypothetical protein
MARQFAARYTDEQDVENLSPLMSRRRAINLAINLREGLDADATVVARRPGGAWEHEWPKPENCFPPLAIAEGWAEPHSDPAGLCELVELANTTTPRQGRTA